MRNIGFYPKINSYSSNHKLPAFKGNENNSRYVHDAHRFLHEQKPDWKKELFKEVYRAKRTAAKGWNRGNNPRGLERVGISLITGGLYEIANLWRHIDTMLADRKAAQEHVAQVGRLIQKLKKPKIK